MFPESGGAVRYGYYSHGSLVGFVAGWAAWIAIASVIPVEAEASVQYMSSWPWGWAQGLYMHAAHGHGELTVPGLCDLRGAGGPVFPGQFLEREGLCRHQQRHHVLQAHRSRRHRHRHDVHRFPCRELPCGPARRRAYAGNLASILTAVATRHRVQLQRIPEPGKPGRRGAKSGPQHPHRDLRVAGDQHRGVPLAADRVPGAVAPDHLQRAGRRSSTVPRSRSSLSP